MEYFSISSVFFNLFQQYLMIFCVQAFIFKNFLIFKHMMLLYLAPMNWQGNIDFQTQERKIFFINLAKIFGIYYELGTALGPQVYQWTKYTNISDGSSILVGEVDYKQDVFTYEMEIGLSQMCYSMLMMKSAKEKNQAGRGDREY